MFRSRGRWFFSCVASYSDLSTFNVMLLYFIASERIALHPPDPFVAQVFWNECNPVFVTAIGGQVMVLLWSIFKSPHLDGFSVHWSSYSLRRSSSSCASISRSSRRWRCLGDSSGVSHIALARGLGREECQMRSIWRVCSSAMRLAFTSVIIVLVPFRSCRAIPWF